MNAMLCPYISTKHGQKYVTYALLKVNIKKCVGESRPEEGVWAIDLKHLLKHVMLVLKTYVLSLGGYTVLTTI